MALFTKFEKKIVLQKIIVYIEKVKVKFFQNFWLMISTLKKENKFTKTEMAPGDRIRVKKARNSGKTQYYLIL